MYKRYWTTISVEIYVELYCSSTRGDCNIICWFKQEECSHLMPASLVYSKNVIECLLHCLLDIPRNIGDAFFYVITCVYTSWKTVVLLFLFHVLDCNAIFANQDLLPTLDYKTRKFWPTYENAWIRPCLNRSTQMSSLCRFTSRRQAEWTPLQASCSTSSKVQENHNWFTLDLFAGITILNTHKSRFFCQLPR